MFKRAISSCASNCDCANRSFTMRMMSMYNDIGRSRKFDMMNGDEQGKYEYKNHSWYRNAGARDIRIGKILLIGSSIIGSAALTTYEYKTRYYNGEDTIRENMIMGGLLGGVTGIGLWLIYPFPSAIAILSGSALFFKFAPKYIEHIAEYLKDSKK
jgi:hypothetical protein